MKRKQDILNRIYKVCFIYPNIKEKLFEDWGYVANIFLKITKKKLFHPKFYIV